MNMPVLIDKLTLRDYFAARAMEGMIMNTKCDLDIIYEMPKICYRIADAMLVEKEFKSLEERGINGGVDE